MVTTTESPGSRTPTLQLTSFPATAQAWSAPPLSEYVAATPESSDGTLSVMTTPLAVGALPMFSTVIS
jgi:hypothetical protein